MQIRTEHFELISEMSFEIIRHSARKRPKMNYRGTLTLVALLLFAVAPCIQSCATMWEHDLFRGRSLVIQSGDELSNMGRRNNDLVTSLKVHAGCSLTLYQHSNFRGRSARFGGPRDVPNLGFEGLDFNDRTSSYKCRC